MTTADGSRDRSFIRIGHGGAAGIAPANTLKSLSTAVELGVDMVEFDVRPCLDDLVLLHDDSLDAYPGASGLASRSTLAALREVDAGDGEPIATLDEALALMKGKVRMNLDLKTVGIEAAIIQKLRGMKLIDEVIISSLHPRSLAQIKAQAPGLKTAISYPKDRGNVSQRPALAPAVAAALRLVQATMRYRVIGMMNRARADATMLHFGVISRSTVRTVHRAGGSVFAWTVDDLPTMRRLRSTGVDGIASNYPGLFNQLP